MGQKEESNKAMMDHIKGIFGRYCFLIGLAHSTFFQTTLLRRKPLRTSSSERMIHVPFLQVLYCRNLSFVSQSRNFPTLTQRIRL